MGAYRMIFGIFVVTLLLIGGFLLLNTVFMNQETTGDIVNQQKVSACESTLDSIGGMMRVGETREIPDNCFEEDEPLTDQLPEAEPGDEFRKTENGIETVSQ